MSATRLSLMSRTQGNNAALKAGEVHPAGLDLDVIDVPVLVQGFRRMVRGLEFDVSEMALTTYVCAKAHGVAFTALPVFLVRGFHHGAVLTSSAADVAAPQDLAGRRIGVNRGYTVTTGVWARAILEEECGLDLDAVTWVLSGDEHVAEFRPPPNVVPQPANEKLAAMLTDGRLAATIGVDVEAPGVRPFFSDPEAAAYLAFRERGLYPINHLVVVRDDVLEAHPDAAAALFEAFAESKRRYVAQLRAGRVDDATDAMYAHVMATTGEDPLPYGLEPNRPILEALVGHVVRQHIIDEPLPIESLFHPSTLDLESA